VRVCGPTAHKNAGGPSCRTGPQDAVKTFGDAEPKTYPVSGTVSLDGQPLEEGDIYFYPLDLNISADAGKIKAGQFAFRTKPILGKGIITS
jgi:hypothetical protein